jgi:hypothetical protein
VTAKFDITDTAGMVPHVVTVSSSVLDWLAASEMAYTVKQKRCHD